MYPKSSSIYSFIIGNTGPSWACTPWLITYDIKGLPTLLDSMMFKFSKINTLPDMKCNKIYWKDSTSKLLM